MTVIAPETEARTALITALKTEFAVEKFPVRADKLHGSLGHEGTVLGISPIVTSPWAKDALVADMQLLVQFFGRYEKIVDPKQRVDPAVIETFAERFRIRLKTSDPKTPGAWYFSLVRLSYPDDPTGNKTRFEAIVRTYGNNTSRI